MQATVGDRIVVREHAAGEHQRAGEILAVEAHNAGPSYRVLWWDTGHEGRFFAGPDAEVLDISKSRRKK